MSLLIKPIAVMFVANGQGLIAVRIPNKKAVRIGIELLSKSVCR